jgi:hypothetical protein
VQNIRLLIPLRLDGTSAFYARWRESFLLTLGRYSLERHVLKVQAELQIEELTMAKTAPATALLSSSGGGTGPPDARPPTAAPKPPHQPQ